MPFKVLIADLFSQENIDNLKKQGFTIQYNDKLNGESLTKALVEFQPTILVVRSTKVTAEHFAATKTLEVVIRAGSGVDTIDIKTANKLGVAVANCPGKNSVAVAELCMGLILAIDRRIAENVNLLKNKQWNKGEFSESTGVLGRTLGIVGYGYIGHEMVKRARSFGMNIVVYSDHLHRGDDPTVDTVESLDELLKRADIVSIHVPATAQTKGMVNKTFLGKMKPNGVLINTARGDLVNEADLVAHLETNKNFWYGADVFVGEPSDKKGVFDSALAKHPRVYGTHHIGASTKQAEAAIGDEAYRMIVEYDKIKVIPNSVNMSKAVGKVNLTVKFNNESGNALAGILDALREEGWTVYNVNCAMFEGGLAGIAKVNLGTSKTGTTASTSQKLKGLKDVLDFSIIDGSAPKLQIVFTPTYCLVPIQSRLSQEVVNFYWSLLPVAVISFHLIAYSDLRIRVFAREVIQLVERHVSCFKF
eukprot:TRINITY_DN7033_c0_g1_i2.p1 TRINITY_DN7033_c0_g1~~TRINITY_DN7033_c0_g1_i2.p1  ORF type:complete len:476 (-),score=123.56 TRINITY_DN7033_c0_g1_i2:186-1613(-)